MAIADWNVDNLQAIKKSLGPERCITFECDVTKEENVKKAVYGTAEAFGTIHVALACAGVAWPLLTLPKNGEMDTKTFQKVLDINLYGTVYMAKYASVVMSKNKPVNEMNEKGVIIFVSSVAAEEGQRGQVAYSATKGALNGMIMPMARDLGRYNIRVLAVAPGIFETPLSSMMSQKVKDGLNANTPMGRMGQPDEFAHFIQAMIENSYLNGVALRLDGATKFAHK